MTPIDDLIKRLREERKTPVQVLGGLTFVITEPPSEVDLAAADALQSMKDALEWYASKEAWTIREVEGPDGDYGQRARRALNGDKE